jgi:streptogramin lyase
VGVEAARCIGLAVLVGVVCPVSHAQTAHFSGAETVVPTGSLNQPEAITADASGNIYISDSDNARILKLTVAGGTYTETVVATGTIQVAGVAVDSNGNVYFGNGGTGQIIKETPSGSGYTESLVPTSALSAIGGLAVDSSGNVYVVDIGHDRVLKESSSGETIPRALSEAAWLLHMELRWIVAATSISPTPAIIGF